MRTTARMLFAAALLVFSGCNDPQEPVSDCSSAACRDVLNAKGDLEAGRYALAADHCDKAVEAAPDYAPAHYCVLMARTGLFVEGVNDILAGIKGTTGITLMSGPRYRAQYDFHSVITTWTGYIEEHMTAIDKEVYFLASHPDDTYQVARLPMTLKVPTSTSDPLFGGEPREYKFDLGGTWDLSEVLLLGSSFNAAQILLDYALAHDVNLRKWSGQNALDQMVADILIENPTFLGFASDDDSINRVFGGGGHKGLRRDLIAAASYLSGRGDSLEGVASENVGLKEAIRLSAASAVTDPVLKWVDADGDGNPEAVQGNVVEQVSALLGAPTKTMRVLLKAKTFDAIYTFAKATSTNAEKGGAPVAVVPMLEGLRADILSSSTEPAFQKPIPEFLTLDFAAFFEQPLPIRELFPYYFNDTSIYSGGVYGLLGEWELVGPPMGKRYYDFQSRYYDETTIAPGTHFLSVDPTAFASFDVLPDLTLADDGVSPSTDVNEIPVVALQNPSFGGLLHLDLTPLGGTATGEATHASINEAIARLMHYYCVQTHTDGGIFNGRWFESLADCN